MIIDRTSPVPSYFQLQTWLIEQIEQGVFKPNEKIFTDRELVELTGLARTTVRQAVQNLVNMGYLVRKKRLGTFVLERNVDSGKQTIVAILIPDIRRGYAPELARGAEDEAAKSKHSLIICNTDDLFVKAEFHANRLIENSVSGVIFVPTAAADEKNLQIIDKFARKKIPIVLADRTLEGVGIDYVTTDNFEGAYELTEYLIKKGHRKIGITLSTLFSTERLRLEGYKEALGNHNVPIDSSIIIAEPGPFVEKRYFQHALNLLGKRDRITAVFAVHDRIALQFYAAANQLGISIPGDISLVGYDDLPFTTISLTTMHQPIYEMGQESMKLIMSRIRRQIKKPRGIVLKSYMVERSSVATIAAQPT
ncbi:MAG: GntR family transcriptional regulator [Candidatus Neomarinimicrobiota bacterium]